MGGNRAKLAIKVDGNNDTLTKQTKNINTN